MLGYRVSTRMDPGPSLTKRQPRVAPPAAFPCSLPHDADLQENERASAHRSVLLITLDTTRADALGCYGAPENPTPHLDRLAARGVRFAHAYAPCPITLPSHATMLTGLYPPETGLRDNSPRALSPAVPLVTEAFQSLGYHTAAFVSAEPVHRKWGLRRGFALYNDAAEHRASRLSPLERLGGKTVDVALQWLEAALKSKNRKPFFLWVHLFDPHHPYQAPPPFADRFKDRPYQAEVAYADSCVGRLLDALEKARQLDETVVVVAGDHGEGLGDHGEATHAHLIFDSTLRVPFLFSCPDAWPGGRIIEDPVGLVDLAPTLYHLIDQKPPRVSGLSLLRALTGKRALPSLRPLYAESLYDFLHFGWAPLYSVRVGSLYLIKADDHHALYDLEHDPTARTDLSPDQPLEVRRLQIQLARMTASLYEPPPPRGGTLNAPPGYLQAPHAAPTLKKDANRSGKRRDPMDAIHEVSTFEQIKNSYYQSGLPELESARHLLGVLLEKDPENPSYLYWAGRLHVAMARRLDALKKPTERITSHFARARTCFEQTLNRRPTHSQSQNLLFFCLISLRDPEPVIKGAKVVLEEGYENRDTRFWLAEAYLQRNAPGDLERADQENRTARERFVDHARLDEQRQRILQRTILRKKRPNRAPTGGGKKNEQEREKKNRATEVPGNPQGVPENSKHDPENHAIGQQGSEKKEARVPALPGVPRPTSVMVAEPETSRSIPVRPHRPLVSDTFRLDTDYSEVTFLKQSRTQREIIMVCLRISPGFLKASRSQHPTNDRTRSYEDGSECLFC